MPKKVAVIDGNSLMHRAYHAIPASMAAPDGTPTNAVFGFMQMLLKFIEDAEPDAVVCAFDAGKPQFRIEELEQYKAQRPPMDAELRSQFPIIEELLDALNIPVIKVKGWEGDDILGTIAARDEALGYETLLVTGDKDACQLATPLTSIVTTKRGITDVTISGPREVAERYGVTPEQFPDYLGLMGDTSDNIPGVPGVGPKRASELLQRFGSLEGIYDHVDEVRGKVGQNLAENKDLAFLSRRIATIVRDLDFDIDLEAASFPDFDQDQVEAVFGRYSLASALKRVLAMAGAEQGHLLVLDDYGLVREGAEAQALIDDALAAGERIGIGFHTRDEDQLFATTVGAFSTEAGTALLTDGEALAAFARIVEEGRFAALDVKLAMHLLCPVDTLKPTEVPYATLAKADGFDLALAAYVLKSSMQSYTYESLAEEYLGGMLPDVPADLDPAVADAVAARVLAPALAEALPKEGAAGVYDDIDLPLVPVLASMERVGARIDCERLAQIGKETQADIDDLAARIYELAGEEFNIDSPKQMQRILFEVLGLKPKKKILTGYSTDATTLKELAKEHELPELVLHYRELTKIKSTYIDALPPLRLADGRLHTQFHQTVTTTGRLSSSNPNLQNIPVRSEFGRNIRACFLPLAPEQLFVSADYSQIELRLLAHLSGDGGLIEAFNSGADFHAATAARIHGVPLDEVTPELRTHAKAVNFGIVYGQQAFGLAQTLDIAVDEAQAIIDRYFDAYPGVRRYLDEVVEQAREKGYAETMFGRRRYIPELRVKNRNQRSFGERTAMNHPMQGSAADIIKLAMREVMDRLQSGGFAAELMLQVHDELDFSAPLDEVEGLSAMVREAMEGVVELKVPLLVDVTAGKDWAEAH